MSIFQNQNQNRTIDQSQTRTAGGLQGPAGETEQQPTGNARVLDRRRLILTGSALAAGVFTLTGSRVPAASAAETGELTYEYPEHGLTVTLTELWYGDRAHAVVTDATVTSSLDRAVSVVWHDLGNGERRTLDLPPQGSDSAGLTFREWDAFGTVHELTLESSGQSTPVDSFLLTWDEIFDAHLPSRGSATLKDVSAGDGHYDDIVWALDRGLDYGGVGAVVDLTYFGPTEQALKRDLAIFLHHLKDPVIKYVPFTNPFADIENSDNVLQSAMFLHERGIMGANTGGDQQLYFEGDGLWTRAQIAMTLWSYAHRMYPGFDTRPSRDFTDMSPDPLAVPAIRWVGGTEIMVGSGADGNEFRPNDTVTRAQLCGIIRRLDEVLAS